MVPHHHVALQWDRSGRKGNASIIGDTKPLAVHYRSHQLAHLWQALSPSRTCCAKCAASRSSRGPRHVSSASAPWPSTMPRGLTCKTREQHMERSAVLDGRACTGHTRCWQHRFITRVLPNQLTYSAGSQARSEQWGAQTAAGKITRLAGTDSVQPSTICGLEPHSGQLPTFVESR